MFPFVGQHVNCIQTYFFKRKLSKWQDFLINQVVSLLLMPKDVWAFGVALWELFSRGLIPYFQLSNAEAADKVIAGLRMLKFLLSLGLEKTKECPDAVYELMKKCWSEDPMLRIKFNDIIIEFDTLINEPKKEITKVERAGRQHSFDIQIPQQSINSRLMIDLMD